MKRFIVVALACALALPLQINAANDGSRSQNPLNNDLPENFQAQDKNENQSGVQLKSRSTFDKDGNSFVAGEIIVKFKTNRVDLKRTDGSAKLNQFATRKNLTAKDSIRRSNLAVYKTRGQETVEQAVVRLKADPDVEYAQPNYRYYPLAIPTNDTFRDQLWALENTGQSVNGTSGINNKDKDIDGLEAWDISEGNGIIVAVIDSGVAYNHPDLAPNMWDGTDCKNENGDFLGDCNYGFDFEDNDKIPLPTSSSHGTHVAGTIAAAMDNEKGIIGVAPQAKIMALKSALTTAQNVEAINFAKENGAKIINASWGCYVLPDQGGNHADCSGSSDYGDQALIDAISGFSGLFVAAAGNGDGDDDDQGDNHDSGQTIHSYPCDLTLANIICVAATDQNDNLADFSDFGVVSVDVGAPGVNILSTVADTILLNETFEGVTPSEVPSGWIKTGDWGTFDVGGSVGNVLYGDVVNIPYAVSADTTITSETYNLSTSGATIDFWTKCDTEYSLEAWTDFMQLEFSTDGTDYVVVLTWDEPDLDIRNGEDPLDDTGGAVYHFKELPIPAEYLTSDFKFQFRWVANGNADTGGGDGCFVNDVKITTFSDGSDELYDYLEGTSMAAPHVAGVAALLMSYNSALTTAQVKQTILDSGDPLDALDGKTVSGKRVNAHKALLAANPAKAITAFSFAGLDPVIDGVINEDDKTITATVPFGTDVTELVPTIVITGDSVDPASSAVQDFTDPVIYTVTAVDDSTQTYTVTVTINDDPDSADVAADTATLVDDSIKGLNADLANITTTLTDPLPASGPNGSTITWESDKPEVVSNDGQAVVRPAFEAGDVAVILTATLTKGAITDTKTFNLTVLKLSASTVTSITSEVYTISTGGTDSETITNVPFNTSKANFLAALTKANLNQTWDDTGIDDPVVSGNTLVVTAQDGTTIVTYTVTAAGNPAKTITAFNFTDPSVTGIIDETAHAVTLTVPNSTDETALTPTIVITGASVSPASGVAQDFISPVTYTVTAADSSTQDYTVTVTIVSTTQTVPTSDGAATANSTTPQVVITSPTQVVTVTVSSGTSNASINYGSLISGGTGTIPQTTIGSASADISIPASTTVTSADSSWNGVIAAPTVTTVTLPDTSGVTKTLSTAIEVGFTGAKLSFDKAVRILLPGQAGKRAGYVRTGITFTEITNACAADNQAIGDALAADGDCKIDVGSDLVIWTKHFTSFAAYTQTTNPAPSDGGGGGAPPPAASAPTASFSSSSTSITAGESVTLTWSTSNATLVSINQGIGNVAVSGSLVVSPSQTTSYTLTAFGTDGTTIRTVIVSIAGQVLGETTSASHPNGTLILDGQTVYLIKDGKRFGFRNPDEYKSHGYNFGQAVTANDADRALSFDEANIVKALEGTLVLDASDNRTVYMIGLNGTKRGFVSAQVFQGLGYKFGSLPKINLTDYPSGDPIGSASLPHPDGALVLEGTTVWWVRNGARQGFESEAVFNTYGFSFSRIVKANAADVALAESSLVKFRDGTLVNDNGAIFIISDGKKLLFSNTAALTTKGYKATNTINARLDSYEAGSQIN